MATVHPTRAVKEVMGSIVTSFGIPGKTINESREIILVTHLRQHLHMHFNTEHCYGIAASLSRY